jgi:putative transposase
MRQSYTRRNTNRIPQHNYSAPGYYFITICTKNRLELFGTVKNGQIVLNDLGNMVNTWWQKTFEKYQNLLNDVYIIMPNHIHGIINIVGAGSSRPGNNTNNKFNRRGDRAPTIGQIIAYFKYQSTKQINILRNTPGLKIWQRNYYDHIIRNEKSLQKIREYIINNPTTWDKDIENPDKTGKIESEILTV